MCNYHMSKNVNDHLKSVDDKEISENLLDDIRLLQKCMNEDQFLKGLSKL